MFAYCIYLLTYPVSFHLEHRAATILFHLTLFFASTFSWFHVFPISLASDRTDLLQVVQGLPLFRFP